MPRAEVTKIALPLHLHGRSGYDFHVWVSVDWGKLVWEQAGLETEFFFW